MLFKVLVQTRIEYLRGNVEEKRTVNHHGKTMEVMDGGKVVGVLKVGDDQDTEDHVLTPVFPFER